MVLLASLTANDAGLSCTLSYGLLAEKLNTTPSEVYQAIATLRRLDFVKVSPDDGHLSYIFRPAMPVFLVRMLERESDYPVDDALSSVAYVQASQQLFQFTLHMPLKGLLALKKSTYKNRYTDKLLI